MIDRVVEELRAQIESGNYKVGDKLPTEKELCQSLQVGRSTVREAFRMLQATGHVEMIPGKGAHVAQRSFEEASIRSWFVERGADLSDYIDVRIAIEPYADGLAAQRASEKEKKLLAVLVEKYREAAAAKDADRLALFDREFHKQVMVATHNRILMQISEAVFENFVPVLNKMLSIDAGTADPATTITYHQAISDAVSAGDALKSEQIMRAHLDMARADIAHLSILR